MIARVEYRTDVGSEFWILDGIAPVTLDEGNHHVFAAQCGQEILRRDAFEGVRTSSKNRLVIPLTGTSRVRTSAKVVR
jgi:hypothetical protein